MSEHPPIPDEFKELFWSYMSGRSLSQGDVAAINEWIVNGVPILWRAWTRGMAVVPLPEPDQYFSTGIQAWLLDECTIFSHAIDGLPFVCEDGGPGFGPSVARCRAAALLAAADRAEQLADEATAVQP